MIPKIVHYCWYGMGEMDWLSKACLKTINIPGAKIIEWNENNSDLTANKFVEDAAKAKCWAYVSDYFRLLALYEYGGIYVDTDIEFRKPLPPSFFEKDLVLGYMYETNLSTAFIMARPKHPYIKYVLDKYTHMTFDPKIPNNWLFTCSLLELYPSFRITGQTAEFAHNCVIYERHYFEMPTFDKKRGFTIHHFSGSWQSPKRRWRRLMKPLFKRLKFHCFLFNWWYQNCIVDPRFRLRDSTY